METHNPIHDPPSEERPEDLPTGGEPPTEEGDDKGEDDETRERFERHEEHESVERDE